MSPDGSAHDREIPEHDDLCTRAGIDAAFLTELVGAGLVKPGPAGFFDEDAVLLARTAKAMAEFGLEVRHLRAFKLAADREAALVAQIVGSDREGPRRRGAAARRGDGARTGRTVVDIAHLPGESGGAGGPRPLGDEFIAVCDHGPSVGW